VTYLLTYWQGNENYTGIAARDTANALQVLTSAVRGVAATSSDRELQDSIVDHARDVMDKSANLIEEAKKAVAHPQNPDNQTRLAQVCDVNVYIYSHIYSPTKTKYKSILDHIGSCGSIDLHFWNLQTPALLFDYEYGAYASLDAPAFTGIHCAYRWRDGQAEFTWVAGYIPR